MRASGFFRIALLSTLGASLTGCTALLSPGTAGIRNSVQISGRVRGGQQPVFGATIQLYAVGTSADGSASTPLLTQAVTTAADGSFDITSLFSCSNATLVYLTAVGGDPGAGSPNPNLDMMVALGPCSSLTPSTFISINEVTTVAAVYALAPFMDSIAAVGSSSSDVAALTSAFVLANQFADSTSGTSPGTNITAGTTIPSTLINTLANIISTCVNSAGGSSSYPSPCGHFFLLTTPGNSPAPAETVGALLYLANNPTLNTALLYQLAPPAPPFQPSLSSAPADFRIGPVPSGLASLQITPSILTFPIGSVSVTSNPQSVTIKNVSSSPANLNSMTLIGADAADFSTSTLCPATLTPTASCTAEVSITPSAAGSRIGYLSIASDTLASPQFVTLTIDNPIPGISSISSEVSNPFVVHVLGSNFLPSSIIQVDGSDRLTGYRNPNELVFQLTGADLFATGNLMVTVVNPTPGEIGRAHV